MTILITALRTPTSELWLVLALAVLVLALMMAGLGVKMLLHKEKEFRRPCANADPLTGRCTHCTCGRRGGGGSPEFGARSSKFRGRASEIGSSNSRAQNLDLPTPNPELRPPTSKL